MKATQGIITVPVMCRVGCVIHLGSPSCCVTIIAAATHAAVKQPQALATVPNLGVICLCKRQGFVASGRVKGKERGKQIVDTKGSEGEGGGGREGEILLTPHAARTALLARGHHRGKMHCCFLVPGTLPRPAALPAGCAGADPDAA